MQNNTFSGLYLRQNLIVLDEVTSTNDYLKNLLSNIKPLPAFTAIMAKHQTQGKGQRGSTWLVEPQQALTFSLLLYPTDLQISQAFNLNIIVCLAIQQWLSQYTDNVRIKWPNDIYVNDRKICGVLIENQIANLKIKSSIIGIGININQRHFPEDLHQRATSLLLETLDQTPQDIESCCLSLLETLAYTYQTYSLSDSNTLFQLYNNLLYRRGVSASFYIQGKEVTGIIQKVNHEGKLVVTIDGEFKDFDLKEIRHL
ncbi:biotin--[acetyl-CoA-carboxylase] ligase [Sphingobacterium wenxiniae]|uniref:BirA family transcriptional regulator, biotin operon repressor / biotin-[acetyl-CoA-carboxylase] ligase n=1 Tax=Sphingobacterium wenxiniae TaxID=683125 RepID=A0A1I6RAW1_9SPHI|nr:biotin--[acetyl-CoA-carboxylase] ligase [Sphingobacterium wenxiniae]SFS61775.1 BirA family transcriptional regulator, biotin operon repressor / biotin-[acetyl-CoA-carboxylase] ligase [Sphingobacterium wenxiniae]